MYRRYGLLLLLVIASLTLRTNRIADATAATTVTISVQPASPAIAIGGSQTVAIQAVIAGPDNLGVWTVTANYDNTILQETNCDGGSAGSLAVNCNVNGNNNEVAVSSAVANGLTGTTTLADITFQGRAAGTGALTLSVVSCSDSNANNDTCTTTNSQISVFALPAVTAVSPNVGPAAGGQSVTISGTNFDTASGGTSFNFVPSGGTVTSANAATNVVCNSATSCTATTPSGSAGTVDVIATTPGGASAAGIANQYTYFALPAVTSLSPSAGPAAGGSTVTITGTNLNGATAVQFGSTAATSFTVNSATSVTATSPAGSVGAVDVTLTTPGGTSATNAGDTFTFFAPPTVTSVSPSAGPVAGGTSVTITGTNFSALTDTTATTVSFGTTAATNVSCTPNPAGSAFATQCTAKSPTEAAGTVDITVTAPGGTSTHIAADQFKYLKLGDVNGDGSVTAVDALCVLRIVVSLPSTTNCPIPTPGNPIIALNETGATTPTAVDALCVLRGVVALPATQNCPLITSPVAGLAAAEGAMNLAPTSDGSGRGVGLAEASVAVESGGRASPGGSTTVQVYAPPATGSLGAWTIELSYDANALRPASCSSTVGSVCNTSADAHTILISGASSDGVPAGSALASVRFDVIGRTSSSNATHQSVITLADPNGDSLIGGPVTPGR